MVNELVPRQAKKKSKSSKSEASSPFYTEMFPPCHIATTVYFTPNCPISGHKSCRECMDDETFWMLEVLRDVHKYGFGLS